MIGTWSKTPSLIGLDVGRTSIKAVQITPNDKAPCLDGAVCLVRSSHGGSLTETEAHRLIRALDRRQMDAQNVVLVAPTDALVGGSISVPPAGSGVPRDSIVQSELSRTHHLTPNSFEFAWWDLPASAAGSRTGAAHAIALPHKAVESTLNTLSELGLATVRTVPTSLALLAAAQRRPIDPRRIAAVLDIGSTRGHLALMYAGRVVHERDLPDFNLTAIRAELSARLNVDDAFAKRAFGYYGVREEPAGVVESETTAQINEAMAALTEEIGMSFAYVSHLYPEAELGMLLLAGGGANIPGLPSAIASVLELETARVSPSSLFPGDCFGSEANDSACAAALGAALSAGGVS